MVGRYRRIGSLVVVACVLGLGAIVPATESSASSTRATAVPAAMVGCWHRHVGALPVGTPAGTWLIGITRAGRLAAYTPGSRRCNAYFDFSTTISVSGKRLTIGKVPICPTKGTYSWKSATGTLTLRATADASCSPRPLLFNGVWKRQ